METMWDVAVIGGGPAGMMAAGTAAAHGARVVLLEKNPVLGKKLLITGGGRCNVLNAEEDTRILLSKYGSAGKYLASAFAQFGMRESLAFFNGRGMATKVEAEKRAFPVTDDARSVRDVLAAYMQEGRVTVRRNAAVVRLIAKSGLVHAALLADGAEIRARSFIVASGGASRPETGSTGDAYAWLRQLSHRVSTSNAALVPVALADAWVPRAAGVSLKNVRVTLVQDGKKHGSITGKILFTHEGLSGPAILNKSRDIGELLQYGPVSLEADLFPDVGYEKINEDLQAAFKANKTKKIKNALRGFVPAALAPVMLEIARINPEKNCSSIAREERVRLMKTLKHLPLSVKGLLGLDRAVITSGGVSLDDIDTKTFASRRFPNLYVVGDVLDVNRPSGGYSLQLCWSTGSAAGRAAAERV